MSVKQREWGIFIRPYSIEIENGNRVRRYHTQSNSTLYLADKTMETRYVNYTCNGKNYSVGYTYPSFVRGFETRSVGWTCNGNSYTRTYQYPILDPKETVELKGDDAEDGVWSLYFKTTSYTYLMDKIRELYEELNYDLSHIKVVELFSLDIEKLKLTWNGGEK